MSRRLNLPASASVAIPQDGGKLFAPSAARNTQPLVDALVELLPSEGTVLEIASGTGQHVVAFAEAFPNLTWQPTEADPNRLASIQAYVSESGFTNILPPHHLDATVADWGNDLPAKNAIFLSNLLHLISAEEAHTLVAQAARALAPGGLLLIYGPFKRGDILVSEGDRSFDASLRGQDPKIGYKSDQTVLSWGEANGLMAATPKQMPANNLLLSWRISNASKA
ncbi:DUF938 domain-containing protein [Shimia sp. NS0008-38b]|uniref:DUF938 domain-containing protein n=1 Tax=Shimia sp. NS0008-38b TaxID=3127653 RepID=UPI00310A1F85